MPKRSDRQNRSPTKSVEPIEALPAQADGMAAAMPQAWVDDEDPGGEDLLDAGSDAVALPPADGRSLAPAQTIVLREAVEMAAHGRRLDQWLAGHAPEFSRSHLQHLIEEGCISVDGREIRTPSRKLQAGQQVVAELRPTPQSQAFVPEAMDLPIVFEDEHLMIVDKPVGLVVHPAAGHWQGTLMNGLLAHHEGAVLLPRAGIVHRLDKDTSGLMVVGKTLQACTALTRAIAAREVHRQYRALVWGALPGSLRIDAPIGRDLVSRVRMAVVASGKPAMTDVHCMASLSPVAPDGGKGPAQGRVSAVECTLHTGRTHQIRVHLASRGCPLLADALYGGAPALGLTRQALHAARLVLTHPVLGHELTFEAPLPADMATAWSQVVHNGLTSV
jgi:23S rRNA pseudouridine1911/1915/1917 synthase